MCESESSSMKTALVPGGRKAGGGDGKGREGVRGGASKQPTKGLCSQRLPPQCEAYMQMKPCKQVQRVKGQDSDLVL